MKRPEYAVRNVALALAAAVLAAGAPAEVLERVVVRVNGDIVTQSEFQARQVAAVQAARVSPERIEQFLRENNARILQEAIDDLLLVQRADELGVRLSSAYIKEVVDGIKKENNIPSDEDLNQQLRKEGMSLDDLKRNIERSILTREVLRRELEAKMNVTEADARADYEARKADYVHQPTVHLQEIVVPASAGRPAAMDLARRARAGEDFAELARQHSNGPTRQSGGELGQVSRGDMAAEIEKVAFALPAGGISDPLPAADGAWRILRVVEKTEGRTVPFAEVKDDIVRRMGIARIGEEKEAYLVGLRKGALVDLRVREVPLQVTVPATSLLEPPGDDEEGLGATEVAAPTPAAGV
ncbi:MAG TPA: peptidyl-prolyl cis-trans isomerase [Vicinamibacteria bacterium]|nr:peptidyl-prolyl cis-trans isomerase [Vicinamibacteria bacterium]